MKFSSRFTGFAMDTTITEEQLAQSLNLSLAELHAWVACAHKSYGKIVKTKTNGKTRIIYPPSKGLKLIQKQLLNSILSKIPTPQEMCSGKGSSTRDIMRRHVNKNMLIRIDLSDFFPNVKAHKIFTLLRERGFSLEVARIITKLTTFRGGLPQGAPCSPQLACLALAPAAKHIINLFKFPVSISFYVDDIIISGSGSIQNFRETIYAILERNGFIVNREKTKIMPKKAEQAALGLRVDHGVVEPDSQFMNKYRNARNGGAKPESIRGMKKYIEYINSK